MNNMSKKQEIIGLIDADLLDNYGAQNETYIED